MDYRFALRLWQDRAGDANAKINVYLGSDKVVDEHEVGTNAVDADNAETISWESTGLAAVNENGSVTASIRVEVVTNYYVDADNDRNIWISGLAYTDKADGSAYKKQVYAADDGVVTSYASISDFTDIDNYPHSAGEIPHTVTGDQLPDNFWDNSKFHYIPVYGGDDGTTMVVKLVTSARISSDRVTY